MTNFARFCSGLTLLVSLGSGCEGDTAGAASPYPELVGAWEYTMGSQVVKCAGRPDAVENLKSTIIEIRPSADAAGGVVRWDPGLVGTGENCYQRLAVTGSAASSQTAHSCVLRQTNEKTMEQLTLTFTFDSLMFNATGQTATETGAGKITRRLSGAAGQELAMQSCDLSLMGLLKRITH